jgi:hypothetical protein
MNKLLTKMIIIGLIVVATAVPASAIVATDWQTATTSTVQGDLNGVTVDVTNIGSPGSGAAILYYDLSGAGYSPYQLAASQETLDYAFNENWTASFSSPMVNLMLYCKYWRGPNNGNADPANFEYEFNTPFTILAGFSNSTIIGNTLLVPSTGFQDGILLFTGPISSISLLSNNANSASRQELTFGLEDDPVSVEHSSWSSLKSLYR